MRVKIVKYYNPFLFQWMSCGIFPMRYTTAMIKREWKKFNEKNCKVLEIKIDIDERACSETTLEEIKGFKYG